MTWTRTGKSVSNDCTTIIYELCNTGFTVESRRQRYPYPTYFVLKDGKELKELWTLKDAKEYAEGLI